MKTTFIPVLILLMVAGLVSCGQNQEIEDIEPALEEELPSPELTAIETTVFIPEFYSRGIEPDGSPFTAGVSVEETGLEGTYLFTWENTSSQVFVGVGMDYGEDLIVVGTEGPMLKIFRRAENGYHGVFFSGENLGKEVISFEHNEDPLPASLNDIVNVEPWPGSPVFEMSGTNADGSEYTGIIQSRPLGAGAQILWTQDEGLEISGGALMLQDSTIVAVYSVGVAVYELIDESIWRGEWYSLNSDGFGIEWITLL